MNSYEAVSGRSTKHYEPECRLCLTTRGPLSDRHRKHAKQLLCPAAAGTRTYSTTDPRKQRQSKLEVNFPSSLGMHTVRHCSGKARTWPNKPWDSGADCSSLPLHGCSLRLEEASPPPIPGALWLAPSLASGLDAGAVVSMEPGWPSSGHPWCLPSPSSVEFCFLGTECSWAYVSLTSLACDLSLPVEYELCKG